MLPHRVSSGDQPGWKRSGETFWVALLLGLTSFGGPIAHLGHFHREYVERRRWLSESTYLDLVALSQVLPGPVSSQVGIGVGLLRAGWPGAFAAWLGFTLPSAVLLTAFALLAASIDVSALGWVHGLKLAAVAIVAAAVVSMWRALAPDAPRRAMAMLAAVGMLLLPTAPTQIVVLAAGGLAGCWLLRNLPLPEPVEAAAPVGRRGGFVAAAAFTGLLAGLPLLAGLTDSHLIAVVESFYRAGALVFGGGHVVLPLLSESVVAPGWVDRDAFLAGYAAAQAVPGPLFTIAAYLGAVLEPSPNGVPGALLALVAIFVPSFLLVAAALPFWHRLRRSPTVRRALAGTNAAVIGLLVSALVDPLWTSTIVTPLDVGLVAVAFGALVLATAPSWAVVGLLALAGQALVVVGVG